MIRLRQVRKRFATGFTLTIPHLNITEGLTLVKGSSGSGKTTLLELLATVIPPDDGSISWNHLTYDKHVRQIRKHIGYVPDHISSYDNMNVQQFLTYMSELKGIVEPAVVLAAMDLFQLRSYADQSISTLSIGTQRRVVIAQAFIGTPAIIVMDNPLVGLDSFESRRLGSLFSIYARTRHVIMVCQEQEEVNCDAVLSLDNGKLFFQ